MLDPLGWQELVLDELQVRLISRTLQVSDRDHLFIAPVFKWRVHIALSSGFLAGLLLFARTTYMTTHECWTVDSIWFTAISAITAPTAWEISQIVALVAIVLSGWLGYFGGGTSGSMMLCFQLLWQFSSILRLIRFIQVLVCLLRRLISSIWVSIIANCCCCCFFDTAKVAWIIDFSSHWATSTMLNGWVILLEFTLVRAGSATQICDKLVKRIISTFLNKWCGTCRSNTLTKFRHLLISTLGRQTPEWTSRHRSFFNASNSFL